MAWYVDLAWARPRTMEGRGGPIPYSEIDAWSRLTGTILQPWEVRALRRLDRLYMEVMARDG